MKRTHTPTQPRKTAIACGQWRTEALQTILVNDGGKQITTPEGAFAWLAIAEEINGAAYGAGASCSTEVQSWRVLLAQPDARDAFVALYERGSKVGQFYALCGLHLTDRARYGKLAPFYFQQRDSVHATLFGCIGTVYEIGELEPSVTNGVIPRYFRTGDPTGIDEMAPPRAFTAEPSAEEEVGNLFQRQ